MRIGHGYDVHRLVEGRKLILGGVTIPYEEIKEENFNSIQGLAKMVEKLQK